MFDVLFKLVFNPVTKKRSQFVLLELCFRFFEKVRLFFVFNSLGFVLFCSICEKIKILLFALDETLYVQVFF